MDKLPEATLHSRRRVKERLKLPPRATARQAEKAWLRGMDETHPDLSPPLRAKILRSRQAHIDSHNEPGIYRVYQGALYIFGTNGDPPKLVTVLAGFDDPDQKGRNWNKGGKRWVRGEYAAFPRVGKKPRGDDHGEP